MRIGFGIHGRLLNFSIWILAGLIATAARDIQAGPLVLTPGSLVLLTFSTTADLRSTVYEETTTGAMQGSLKLPLLGDLAETMTVLNGQLYVGDGAGRVNRIDPASGNLVSYFSAPEAPLVGNSQGNLLVVSAVYSFVAGSYVEPDVDTYSTTGTLLQTIALQTVPPGDDSFTGVTSDGSALYLPEYYSGLIYKYSPSGILLGTINTGFASSLFGLSYDSSNNSFWTVDMVNGFAYDFSTSGALISQFDTGVAGLSGVAFVPEVATPEPDSYLAMLLGIGLVGVVRRQGARS